MRIAFLSRYQGKIQRGAENFVEELTKRLKESNQVDILSAADADSLSKIVKGNYDIVVPINGKLQSLKASLARFVSGYKVLITGHSGIGRDDLWNIMIVRPDVFVALTDLQKDWARRWGWGTKVVKIPNGVDLENFSPNGEKIEIDLPRPILLSVGALVWYKYLERVIRALSKLGYGSLLLVGEGSKKDQLNILGEKLLKGRFKLTSFKYEDMPKVYRSADLFTLPSWDREAFGIVYLEALACGIGVVVPDDSSRREIVGEAGIFVDTLDLEKYSKAIEQALKKNWAKKARKQAEKFSWENIAESYEKLMLDMIKIR